MNIGIRKVEVLKKRARHRLVVVLSRMHENMLNAGTCFSRIGVRQSQLYPRILLANCRNDWSHLHEIRAGPYHTHHFHFAFAPLFAVVTQRETTCSALNERRPAVKDCRCRPMPQKSPPTPSRTEQMHRVPNQSGKAGLQISRGGHPGPNSAVRTPTSLRLPEHKSLL